MSASILIRCRQCETEYDAARSRRKGSPPDASRCPYCDAHNNDTNGKARWRMRAKRDLKARTEANRGK